MTNLAKLNAYIYGSQAFAKLFEQPSYSARLHLTCIYTYSTWYAECV